MKAGRPSAIAARLSEAMSTSRALMAPYWNSVPRMGPARITSAKLAGRPITRIILIAQSRVWRYSAFDCVEYSRDSPGRITVAIAMPNTPNGSSVSRSE